jgi:hypothetical protein
VFVAFDKFVVGRIGVFFVNVEEGVCGSRI